MKVVANIAVGIYFLACLAAAGQSSSSAAAESGTNQRTDRAVKANAQAGTSASAKAGAGGTSADLSSDTTIQAELTKSLDARKAKQGDPVTARVRDDVKQDGRVVLRRGTKLIGHITEAKAMASGEADSEMGIIFDRAEIKGGQNMDLHAAVQAIAPAVRASYDDSSMSDVGTSPSPVGSGSPAGPMGTGAIGGATNTVGGVASRAGNTADGVTQAAGRSGARASGTLNAASRGVNGLPGVQISDSLSNSTNGTVLVSRDKTIRLDSGTQMVLRVIAQPGR